MLVAACATGTLVAVLCAKRARVRWPPVALVCLAGCFCGVAGARLWSIAIESVPLGRQLSWDSLLQIQGLSVFGGILGSGAFVVVVARRLKLRPVELADLLSLGFAAGLSVGRIGCVLAGCCYGRATLFPIALIFERFDGSARPIGVPLHATQLYESAAALVVGIVALLVGGRPGTARCFGIVALGYGIARSLIEPLRGDYRGWITGLPATSIAAWVLVAVGASCIWWSRRALNVGPST